MANQYLVQLIGYDSDPPGPEPGYGQRYPEPVAEGPVDTNFALPGLNGQNIREYVTDCKKFMRYVKEMVEGMLRALPKDRSLLRKDRSLFDIDLSCLIDNIRERMDRQSHVTSGLERLQHAPRFTSEERRNDSEEMALYRCADEGRQLMQTYYFQLIKLPLKPDAQLVAPLLNALIRELKTWIADACHF